MAVADVPEWDPESNEPGYLFVRLADHIAARIAAGQLQPNAMLPNEREMVAEYRVSIDTVRRAVAELRDRGLVVTFPSKGTYVTGTGHEQGTPLPPETYANLRQWMSSNRSSQQRTERPFPWPAQTLRGALLLPQVRSHRL